MIPILYEKNEANFTSNGLGRLADCISCTVTEERNGIYECQFTYPITGEMFPEIQEGRIVGVIHDDQHDVQPFDIYSRSAPLNGVVTFYAHHVSYRLGNVILRPVSASTCAAAMEMLGSRTYNPISFRFWTDKVASGNWTVEVPTAVRAILGGQQGSILDVFGPGDYEFDRWTVKLHADRGNDNGVSIRYGVNLTDLTQNVDTSSAYTALLPYWLGPEGELVTLPEIFVAREGLEIVPVPLDLSSEFEEEPTAEQLRAKATSVLESSRPWLTRENLRVSFVDLAHTEEYKSVAALQRVCLCDRVSVYYGDMDIEAVKVKVVRVVYNVLTERYDEIELGDPKTSLAQTIAAQFSETTSDLPTTVEVRSMLAGAVDNATAQITGALGGFVRFMYDADGHMTEILIMDTDDISTAQKVWRWNSGGLGFSANGYDGPYGTAITQDGAIVADYITGGTMNANLLRTGIITSRLGGSYWNLDTGELVIGGMSASDIVDNVGESIIGVDTEFAQSQSSSVAPTSDWSTVAPSWAAGWYIWQRTKTTTPAGVEYSDPVCISGRDGSSAAPGLNQATLYLYQRASSQPAKPAVSMVYTFADGTLTNIPAGWSRSIPSGSDTCWVTSAAAISSDTAVTLTSNSWQDPVAMAANGATVVRVESFFAATDSTIAPPTEDFFPIGVIIPLVDHNGNYLTDHLGNVLGVKYSEPPIPTTDKPYVWTFQRSTYTDGSVLDSTRTIAAVLAVGVEDIVEEYYLSTSASTPTGGNWTTTQPEWQEGTYLWTRTKVSWTDGEVTYTDPILARAINAANEAAAAASAKADSASAREQTIYRSVVSGTVSLPAYTTWVTNASGGQNVWTTTRPVYSSTYPVLFVATQRQTVEQRAAGSACSCTTPVVDQTTTVIDGGHITTGTIDAGVVNVTNIKAGNIVSGTIRADLIGANSIDAGKLSVSVNNSISNAQTTANGANKQEQIIYRSAPSGTTSMAKPTSWITASGNTQGDWTTRRPVYSGDDYPVLFVATQRQTVGGTVTCTTPVIDQTTTVIDGGHITTGTIDAGKVNVTNINASNIKGGTLTLGGSNNTNGTLVVKDAQGNVVGTWNNSGISIDKGDINIGNNFIVDNSGNVTAKSLTANDYLHVDGNSNSYFNIPLVNNGYFRISDSGLTINTYALSPVPMRSIGGLDNVIVNFGGNKGTSLFESVYPIMLNSTKYPDAFLGIAPGQLYIESENYQSYVFRIRVMPDGIWMESKGSSGTFETNSSYRTNCTVGGQLAVKGKMTVDGTKSRSVTTDQYSDRLLYCYETPTPMFGDIGEGVIAEDGLCYVWLDPVFAQTVTTDQYQVFLQCYGEGDCWVKERRGGCFTVQGTPGLAFGWEVKAKQRDYDQLRLERNEEPFTLPTATYGADAAQHIDEIRKERDLA